MLTIKKISISLISIFLIVMLGACSGKMRGVVQPSGESVNFQFEDNGMGSGTLKTTLANGETFQGKFIEASSSGFGTSYGSAWSGSSTAYGSSFGTFTSYSGNVEAVLFGNKKHSMKCRFRVADSSLGLISGGVGMCQVSDGRVIHVQF